MSKLKKWFSYWFGPILYRESYLLKGDEWLHVYSPFDTHIPLCKLYKETHPYVNVLSRNRGKYQRAVATVNVVKRTYRYLWRWSKTVRTLDIEFNRHMGSGANSFRGGILESCYEMKRNETPGQTIERMQKEYRFK